MSNSFKLNLFQLEHHVFRMSRYARDAAKDARHKRNGSKCPSSLCLLYIEKQWKIVQWNGKMSSV